MTLRRVLPMMVLLLAAAGCGNEAGEALPASPTASPSPSPTETGVPGLPPRPVAVPLGGVDPCTVLTPEQLAQFGLDSDPGRDFQPSEDNAETCTYRNDDTRAGARVIPSIANGIGVWLDGTRGGVASHIKVAGFRGVEIRDESLDPPYCAVAVDVADGQQLIVASSPSFTEPAPIDEQCASAVMYAEAAMQTLVAR